MIRKFNKMRHKFIKALWNFWTSQTGAFILAVSGIAIGYYIFYISRPILKYDTETVTFISPKNQNEYKVSVRDKEYEELYMTNVILQNKGAIALSGKDVSKIGHDPIRIVIPKDAKLVHFNLDKKRTTAAISANLQEHNGDVIIEFDYLNSGYQIVTNLLYENNNAKFYIAGSALNVNEITREWNERIIKFWGIWGLGFLYCILIAFYIYNHWYKKRKIWKRF